VISRTQLEAEDIQAIASAVAEMLKPLIAGNDKPKSESGDRYLNVKQLSEYTSMSAQWIYNNMRNIPHINLNRKPLFRKLEIDLWLKQHRVTLGVDSDLVVLKPSIRKKVSAGVMKIRHFKQRRAVTSL
jgi:predicted DNA-binding transcriptional regulator AlpA